ncbi:MAG: hypothetical protein OXR62_00235 [Ahrensia sp.]|nr:hypothetical protein [Ahrensia sp.]
MMINDRSIAGKAGIMSKLEKIERDFRALTESERKEFLERVLAWQDEAWDHQIASDLETRKLDDLLAEADRDIKAGRSTSL